MNEIVLETVGLTKYYGQCLAVDHLDLQIPRGCICGFIGRNGAGKTTAIKMMLGLLRPTAGSAQLLGCDCQELSPQIRQRIGYVTEGHRLIGWMSIAYLESFQKAFFPRLWDDKLFAEMMEYFGLSKKQKIKHLSTGQRAQVSLALTLAPNPELLIMDDPTLGLDAAIRRQFLEGVIQLIMRQGRTILFSSHILGDIDKGELRANCSLEEFRKAVKKVKFSFVDSIPEKVDIDGLLYCRRQEKDCEMTLVRTSDEQITQWAKKNNAERYHIVEMNLEDQFIEYTAPHDRKKLFKWEET